jgi:hypothetical protein
VYSWHISQALIQTSLIRAKINIDMKKCAKATYQRRWRNKTCILIHCRCTTTVTKFCYSMSIDITLLFLSLSLSLFHWRAFLFFFLFVVVFVVVVCFFHYFSLTSDRLSVRVSLIEHCRHPYSLDFLLCWRRRKERSSKKGRKRRKMRLERHVHIFIDLSVWLSMIELYKVHVQNTIETKWTSQIWLLVQRFQWLVFVSLSTLNVAYFVFFLISQVVQL